MAVLIFFIVFFLATAIFCAVKLKDVDDECEHKWYSGGVWFTGGKQSHHEKRVCEKCGKMENVFSGTREEWYKFHNMEM